MAKKQTKKVEVTEEPLVEEKVVVEAPKPEPKPQPVVEKETPKKDVWEFKDRTYFLKGKHRPLSFQLRSSGIYYFDEEKGYERELKNTANQRTPFVDEMQGDQRLEHIVFRNGALFVPKNKVILQKLLSLYHPHKDIIYEEFKPQVQAANELDVLEFQIEAMSVAKDIDIEMAEAVMRAEIGSRVSTMTSKELRRDMLLFAKKNPRLFLELVTDDNVMLRNFGIRAAEAGIIKISGDQRHFSWGSTGRKLMTVPFDEHPYSALANWFKTDEGMEVYSNIEKRLN
tara:strand:+ start:590 stop:1441 length:852 start_codon:yes stop_codon:yes gene_type:complete